MSITIALRNYIEELLEYYEKAKADGLGIDNMAVPYDSRIAYEKAVLKTDSSAKALGIFYQLNHYASKYKAVYDSLVRWMDLAGKAGTSEDYDWRPEKSKLPTDSGWPDDFQTMSKHEILQELESVKGVIKGLCIGLDVLYETGSYGICEELLYEYMDEFEKYMIDEFMRNWFEEKLDDY